MSEYKPKIIGIIPARMASKRFNNKPMADINGMPMIGHVYNRMLLCEDFTDVFVASADQEILDYFKKTNGNTIDIAESHISSIDRVAEAVKKIEQLDNIRYDMVVLIQCDEPMITPDLVGCLISPMIMDQDLQIAALMSEIVDDQTFENTNKIKVVVDTNNNALYFSRQPIPYGKCFPRLKLGGVEVFRRDFLDEFNNMFPTPLEIAETIDLNRVIESSIKVKMVMASEELHSVDTIEDLDKVKKLMKNDYLITKYIDKK